MTTWLAANAGERLRLLTRLWPVAFAGRQRFAAAGDGLDGTLTVRSRATRGISRRFEDRLPATAARVHRW
jgi:hypothetical protein